MKSLWLACRRYHWSRVVDRRPQLLALAGIRSSIIEQTRERIGEERVRQAAAEAALRDLFGDVPVSR